MAQGIHIGKVAEQTDLSIDTIRFYQKIGLVKQPARSEGGFRLFSEMEIRNLVFIQKAQELGFSLTEIKQLSVLNQHHDPRVFSGARPANQQAQRCARESGPTSAP